MLFQSERNSRRGRDDDGAILVVWAVALVALLGLTAMALDLGNIAQTKQHAVSAAQDAALSGVADLVQSTNGMTQSAAEALAVADAEKYLARNYSSDLQGKSLNFSDQACNLPSGVIRWPSATCIGFFTDGSGYVNGIAVALPRTVKYTLGRAAGLNSQGVSGVAFASVQTAYKGLILPFGYSGLPGLQCIQDFSSDSKKACGGFVTGSGNRGEINSPRYYIATSASNSKCNTGSNDPCMMANIALGIDHELVSGGSPAICDWTSTQSPCTANNAVAPHLGANYINPQTGNNLPNADNGLFNGLCFSDLNKTTQAKCPSGDCWLQPRFNHVDNYVPSSSSCDAGVQTPSGPDLSSTWGDTFGDTSIPLNGKQVAAYLITTSTPYTSCSSLLKPNPGQITSAAIDVGGLDPTTNVWYSYDNCLSPLIQTSAAGCPVTGPTTCTPIFQSTIESAPRFGIVPVFSGSGSAPKAIQYFLGVYLDLAFPAANGNDVGSLAAWVFPLGLIDGVQTTGTGLGGYYGGNYVTNLCAYGVNC